MNIFLLLLIFVSLINGQCNSPSFELNCPGFFSVSNCADISMNNNCVERNNGDPICLCPIGYDCSGPECQGCNINGYNAIDPYIGESCIQAPITTTISTSSSTSSSASISGSGSGSTTGIIYQSSSTLSGKTIGLIVGIVAGVPLLIAVTFIIRWKFAEKRKEKQPLLAH